MSYEIRVSKKGYDAIEEDDPNNFIMHTAYNTFKIVKEGSGSFEVSATSDEDKTITHNYGTRTGFIVFFKHDNDRVTFINNWADDGDGTSSFVIRGVPPVKNSANSITFRVYNGAASAKTVYYKYYLFEIPL